MKKLNKTMKYTVIIVLLLLTAVTFTKCTSSTEGNHNVLSEETIAGLVQIGDSIANIAQQTLMKNVATAMQKGGSEYAVDFCNLQAMPLTDSISNQYQVEIQRLSDKNRSPQNTITSDIDQKAWEGISKIFADNQISEKHLIIQDGHTAYYYKAIPLGMTTCLNCHGQNDEVNEKTRALLREKYPDDKALGYAMGELRGMWKIKISDI